MAHNARSRGWVCWMRRIRLAVAVLLFYVCTISNRSMSQISGGHVSSEVSPRTVRISVFSLFKPKALRISTGGDTPVVVDMGGQVELLPLGSQALIELAPKGGIRTSASSWRKSGDSLRLSRSQNDPASPAMFWLEVPGKLRRKFTGTLEIRAKDASLEAIVTMPLETAVASVVQAESPPGAPLEALKAQAVAARSFLVAKQAGHIGFDFCDTTHCQFLRSPPSEDSLATKATKATKGLVLSWHDPASAEDRTLPAMYARSCGGHTRSLREIGVRSSGYPYYAVRCAYCIRRPELWQRNRTTPNDESYKPRTEQERLAYNRVHGWSAIPSLAASPAQTTGEHDGLPGRGVGHGLGLCQLGAADMARHGSSFDRILAHYYPNTRLVDLTNSRQQSAR
jgi:stage II sporulation protein D